MDPFMREAFLEAKRGIEAGDGGPFGAVIVKDGKIIASGHNEVVKTNDPTAHAEMIAIRNASAKLQNFKLEGCTLYVTGEPCPMCFSAIHWAHIERVYYCNTKEDAARIGFDDSLITEIILGKKKDPVSFMHTPHEQCQTLFSVWYEDPEKIPY
ncbi:nucleoside deaminase [Sulfurovum sp. NBC37-1]|uniref:nucleoside deaminase n=1 Tax=Sulfurovum sp. (strain NBC37-1) TaxID=387093 RepID=UPI000158757B|nr:nucleoside deaminase [Sulfurovum sp. NBC37-1]BAF72138.1 cytidine/deoxycytidylate deaminase family protein [Sulfurovum sp. NBC37-1]